MRLRQIGETLPETSNRTKKGNIERVTDKAISEAMAAAAACQDEIEKLRKVYRWQHLRDTKRQ